MRRLALLLLVNQACSFVFVSGPPDGPTTTEPTCTRKPLLPAVDNYASLAFWLAGLILVVKTAVPSTRGDNPARDLAVAGGAVVVGVGFALSSNVGFRRVQRCNRAVRHFEEPVPISTSRPTNPQPPPSSETASTSSFLPFFSGK